MIRLLISELVLNDDDTPVDITELVLNDDDTPVDITELILNDDDTLVDITELVLNDDLLLVSNMSMQLGLFKDLKQVLSLIKDFTPKVPKNNQTPFHILQC